MDRDDFDYEANENLGLSEDELADRVDKGHRLIEAQVKKILAEYYPSAFDLESAEFDHIVKFGMTVYTVAQLNKEADMFALFGDII
jgi:hypothetical protein